MSSLEFGKYVPKDALLPDMKIDDPEKTLGGAPNDPKEEILDLVKVKKASHNEMPTLTGTLEQTMMTPEQRLLHLQEKKRLILQPLRELQAKYRDSQNPDEFHPMTPEDRAQYLRLDSQVKQEIQQINSDINGLHDFQGEEIMSRTDEVDTEQTLAA